MPQRRPTHGKRTPAQQRQGKRSPVKKPLGSPSIKPGVSIPTTHSDTLLTRRHFLFGALGVGVVAAVGSGAALMSENGKTGQAAEVVEILEVPTSAVFSSDELPEPIPAEQCVNLMGTFDLPYGTLLWTTNDSFAACLLPTTDSASPLTQVALLSLSSGQCPVVLEQAVGQAAGFDIYDVRASKAGLVWTEANIFDGVWRIYAASLSAEGVLGNPALVESGDSQWETPTIAAVGSYAFWQVLPSLNGEQTKSPSRLMRAEFGRGTESETVYSSNGRMCTPPYALADSLVITPRAATTTTSYQLTLIDAESAEVRDKVVLPSAMKPLEAGYGTCGFTFSFDGAYKYGDGIANLGTYTPSEEHGTQDYKGLPWFHFSRTPTAAPSWCNSYFVVKSSRAVVGIDLATRTYFSLPIESGCDSYGDYLASSGTTTSIVTFTNINDRAIDGTEIRLCRVRVWEPIT